MEQRNWKYKINGGWPTLIMASVMLAIFGGITVRLYTTRNGAFIGGLIVTVCMAIGFILSVCSVLFFKVFVDKDGFFCQTAPGNGRYYRYSEIRNMWLSSGRETNARQPTYCNFETVEGKRMRFLVLGSQIDAVDYMIERVESMGNKSGEDEFDREIVITGKKEAGFVLIPTILSVLMAVVAVMIFLASNLPPILVAIPIIFELVSLSQILSLALFYKVQLQKDGFYCRTNPFDGRYYRYSDILDCRLVESQRKFGSPYKRGVRQTYYFYDMKFVDRAHQTHRLPYNKSLYEGEIDELVARIERAHSDET